MSDDDYDEEPCPHCAENARLADTLLEHAFLNEAADEMAVLIGDEPCRGALAEAQRTHAALIRRALGQERIA